MSWIIDLVLVLILAAGIAIGYREGLIKMLIAFVVVAVAFGAAYTACEPLSVMAYDNFLKEKVDRSVDDALLPQSSETIELAVEQFLSGSSFGFVGSTMDFDAAKIVDEMDFSSVEQVAETVKNDVIRPPALAMLKAIAFAFTFLVLWVVLSLVARIIKVGSKLPILHGINALTGSVLGLVISAVLVVGICAIMEVSLKVGSVGLLGFTPEMRDQSMLYRVIANILSK